jgi:hypothetical protein
MDEEIWIMKMDGIDKSNQLNAGIKGMLLVFGAYLVTIGVAIAIIVFAIIILSQIALDCSDVDWALVTLWSTIALEFLISVILVRVVARKVIPTKHLAALVVHIILLLASYVVIAFGLLVLFNC